jgi:molecular chaperone DnaJ
MAERGSDLKIRLPLTLEEIATGIERTIKIRRWTECDDCRGIGAIGTDGFKKCHTCNGTGEIKQVTRSFIGQIVNISACGTCNGTGQIISNPCKKCGGEGRQQIDDTVKVTIPAGVEEGNYLPIRNKGNAGKRGGEPGDLIIVIEETKHPFFERHAYDVVYRLTISFPDAALGTIVEIPTLYGKDKIRIEAGTQPGTTISLRDKGIPHLNSYNKGQQVVLINIYVPENLNVKDKTILRELSVSENIKPAQDLYSAKGKDFFDKVKDFFG